MILQLLKTVLSWIRVLNMIAVQPVMFATPEMSLSNCPRLKTRKWSLMKNETLAGLVFVALKFALKLSLEDALHFFVS